MVCSHGNNVTSGCGITSLPFQCGLEGLSDCVRALFACQLLIEVGVSGVSVYMAYMCVQDVGG